MRNEMLLTFVAIHRTGSISGASARLHRSQPAISRRLMGLERSLGAKLFDRTPAGLHLTSAGQVLLPYAEAAMAAETDGIEAVREHADRPTGGITLAIVGSLATSWLTAALRDFARRNPDVDLSITTANSREVCDQVRSGDAIAGVTYARPDDRALSSEILFGEDLVVICAADHPLAGRTVASLADLHRERWLAFPPIPGRSGSSANHVRSLLDLADVPPELVKPVDSLTAQKRLAEAGFGIAALPNSAVGEELAGGQLGSIRFRQPLPATPVRLATRAHGYRSRAAQELVGSLRRSAPA
jgi:DNA-binding transcriptional LysR family regulator